VGGGGPDQFGDRQQAREVRGGKRPGQAEQLGLDPRQFVGRRVEHCTAGQLR
jgi:hypothetical protein